MKGKAIAFLVRRQCDVRLSLILSAAAIKIRRPQSAITTVMSALVKGLYRSRGRALHAMVCLEQPTAP
jgi:hypothetical protein